MARAGLDCAQAHYYPLVCGGPACSGTLFARYIAEGVDAIRAALGGDRPMPTSPANYSAEHVLTPLRTYCAPRA